MPSRRLILAGVALLGMSAAVAADVAELVKDCNDCHGDKGVSLWADVPTIAGISPLVLADMMTSFRNKEAPCKQSQYRQGDKTREKVDMCTVAGKLSDIEIDALGDHYAKLPFVAAKQPFDTTLAKQGKIVHDRDCEKCHADSGRDPEEDAGILAGQWTDYLQEQFDHYRAGKRPQPEKMEAKIKKLTDEDIKALLNFYASFQ